MGDLFQQTTLTRIWAGCIVLLFGSIGLTLSRVLLGGNAAAQQISILFWPFLLIVFAIAFLGIVAFFEVSALKYAGYGVVIILLGALLLSGSPGSGLGVSGSPSLLYLSLALVATGSFGFAVWGQETISSIVPREGES